MLEGGDIMLRIAICDDIPEQLDIMEKAVLSYFHLTRRRSGFPSTTMPWNSWMTSKRREILISSC